MRGRYLWIAAFAALLGGCTAQVTTVEVPPATMETAGAVRYVVSDSHFHYVDFLQRTDGIDRVIEAMDAAGVEHSMISGMALVKKWNAADPTQPGYYLDDDSRTYWYSATDVLVARAVLTLPAEHRRRLHPFITGINSTDMNAVDHVERLLEWYPNFWEGVGELFGHHDDLTALTYGETPRGDHPALDPVYALAGRRDLPVSLHNNITSVWKHEPIFVNEMKAILQRHPNTRFIWCHAGISRRVEVPNMTEILSGLLSRYSNLWIDLSWVVYEEYVAPDGVPDADWVALAEEFPTRLMIGSDTVARMGKHAENVQRYYPFLDALSPDVARRVARDNFLSILPQRARLGLTSASSTGP